MTTNPFTELGLADPLLRALDSQGFTAPTPIQAQAIPVLLEGRDLLGIAQTGTGKTGAFVLPILQHLSRAKGRTIAGHIRALILAPTRELAVQIDDSVRLFGRNLPLKRAAIYGGVSRKNQIDRLARGVDIVVGTPGRVLDLINAGHLRLDLVTHFVLDEGDQMLDLGFIRDIRRIIAGLPQKRQSMLFSATMPPAVATLAEGILRQPVRVQVSETEAAPEKIEQKVYFVKAASKRALLQNLLEDADITRAIVFTRTKHTANRVAEHLCKSGTDAEALHGNKSQAARQRSLERFRSGKARVLVATDIAARGIDISAISHVINFELPNVAESYVHRIGRTARAGASGIALSFCDSSERGHLKGIERLTGQALTVVAGTAGLTLEQDTQADDGAARREKRPQDNRPRNGDKSRRHRNEHQNRRKRIAA